MLFLLHLPLAVSMEVAVMVLSRYVLAQCESYLFILETAETTLISSFNCAHSHTKQEEDIILTLAAHLSIET